MKRMLVDVSSLLRRYHAIFGPDGISEMLLEQLYYVKSKFRVDQVILAFDGRDAATWRRQIYPGYKADRSHDMEVRQCVRDFYRAAIEDFHCEVVPEFEADDVIATIVHHIREHDPEGLTIIYSRDQDFHALLSSKLWQLMECVKGKDKMFMTVEKLIAKFGLHPEQWVEYRMLMGDATDGIAGLPGWGPTYAVRVLKQTGTLEEAVKIWDKLPVPKTQRETLLDSYENGDLDILRQIVTMRTDVPVKFSLVKPKEGADGLDSGSADDPVLRSGCQQQGADVQLFPAEEASGANYPDAGRAGN